MAGVLLMPAFVILLALVAVFLFGMALGIWLAHVPVLRRTSEPITFEHIGGDWQARKP